MSVKQRFLHELPPPLVTMASHHAQPPVHELQIAHDPSHEHPEHDKEEVYGLRMCSLLGVENRDNDHADCIVYDGEKKKVADGRVPAPKHHERNGPSQWNIRCGRDRPPAECQRERAEEE